MGDENRRRHIFTLPAHDHVQLDEDRFLTLLEGSVSLSIDEKKRVVDSVPNLSYAQIEELVAIFEQEQEKFAQLEEQFPEKVQQLRAQREKEAEIQHIENEEIEEAQSDADEAEALRRSLGL